jgi:hypothetical protein
MSYAFCYQGSSVSENLRDVMLTVAAMSVAFHSERKCEIEFADLNRVCDLRYVALLFIAQL